MIPSSPIRGFTTLSFRCRCASGREAARLPCGRAARRGCGRSRRPDRRSPARRRRARSCGRSPAGSRRSRSRCRGTRPAATAPNSAAPRAGIWRRVGDAHAQAARVGEQLHRQRALLGDPAAGDDLAQRQPVLLEVLDDPPVAERDRLEQRAVDLLARRLQRQPEERAAEVGVGEDRAVAVPPVERDEPALPGPDRSGRPLEVGQLGARRARASRRTRRACRRPPPAPPRSRRGRAGCRRARRR